MERFLVFGVCQSVVGQVDYRFDHRQCRKQRVRVPERRAYLVPVGIPYPHAPLGIVTYNQRLAVLDVFLVVCLQPAALFNLGDLAFPLFKSELFGSQPGSSGTAVQK